MTQARIKRLTLQGFKSFYDRTELMFDAPVSAVVGPNGCGKSNISDAISWVLGEQSAKSLRGGKMEDVIFNGSAARQPLGMAEIALDFVVRDDEGRERENVVARRLYRTGESEYLINGMKVRLKDVQEFLHDLAIGARTYAVIEQGKIDEVLKAKPEERRELLEEAAGIAKFRAKKRSAELKLASTRENLDRLTDILKEIEAQLSTLRRQAQRAEQYKKLEVELAASRQAYFHAAAWFAAANETESAAARQLAEDAYAKAAAERARVSSALEKARRAQEEGEARRVTLQQEAHQCELSIEKERQAQGLAADRLLTARARKQELAGAAAGLQREIAETTARAAAIAAQTAAARATYDGAAASLQKAESSMEGVKSALKQERERRETLAQALFLAGQRAARAKAELENHAAAVQRHNQQQTLSGRDLESCRALLEKKQGEVSAAQSAATSAHAAETAGGEHQRHGREALDAQRAALQAAEESLRAAHREHDALAARQRSLAELLQQRTDYSQEARHVLALLPGKAKGFADGLKITDTAWRLAIEALLGPLMDAVSVDSADDADQAINELKKQKLGQVFLYLKGGGDALHSGDFSGLIPPSKYLDAGHPQGAVLDRLGALAQDRAAGLRAHAAGFTGFIATQSGELLLPSGFIKAGGEGRSSLILKRQEDLNACDASIAAATAALERAQAARQGAESALQAAVAALEESGREQQRLERARLESDVRLRSAQDELNRQQQVLADLESGHRRTGEELVSLDERHASTQQGLTEAEAEGDRVTADLDAAALRIGELESEMEEGQIALAEQRGAVAVAKARLETVAAEQAAADSQQAAVQARAAAQERELLGIEQTLLAEQEKLAAAEQAAVALTHQLQSHRAALQETEAVLLNLRAELKHLESEERMKAESAETLGREAEDRRLTHVTLQNDLKHLLEEATEALGVDPREQPAPEADQLTAEKVGELKERQRRYAERQLRFGPVNLMALDEFAEIDKRFQFMNGQKQDLDSAMAELTATITEINATTKDRFAHAWEAVAKNFHDIFLVLFDGGEARLKLTDENNLLESGIEIYAQPPGKKLTSLNLLSGGERALTTLAFLFAIFRYKPAPFCLMDETDAPLDDVNVERYKRLLAQFREDTQFILVTHNRATMAAADNIFGVTMEEPGISKIVSVKLDPALPMGGAESATQTAPS
jgi:chromosome segregation protein